MRTRGALAVIAAVLLAGVAARAADPLPSVDGWTLTRVSPMACAASGPSVDGVGLSLGSEGPLFLLVVSAPDFPTDKASYQAELSFDGKPPLSAVALGSDGVMGFSVGRSGQAQTLAAASRVRVTIEGRSHEFALRNVRAALDAVARCAGAPTLSEQVETPPQPIAGAGGWTLLTQLPGLATRSCEARIPGDQIDTILLRNKDGRMVLMGGHWDWATWGGEVPLQLSIDGAAPVSLTAQTVNNLIAVLVNDPALEQRLRTARSLEWTIPTGRVRGDVTGLGVAFDAVAACQASLPAKP